jgi:hypothetical protein
MHEEQPCSIHSYIVPIRTSSSGSALNWYQVDFIDSPKAQTIVVVMMVVVVIGNGIEAKQWAEDRRKG